MIGVKQQFERERGEQDSKFQQLAACQEVEIERVKQQVREVREKLHVSNTEITNSVKEDVYDIQERLSKVEGIRHELLHLNSNVEQIQQKLKDDASKASRQLREQGRQKEQNKNRSSSVQESSLGLAGDVTEGVVKLLRSRADKKLDAELAKKANVTYCSTDNCEVQVPSPRSPPYIGCDDRRQRRAHRHTIGLFIELAIEFEE
jgi:hypothetical protein